MADRIIEPPLALYQVLEAELAQEYEISKASANEAIKRYAGKKEEIERKEEKEYEDKLKNKYKQNYNTTLKDAALEWECRQRSNDALLPHLFKLIHSLHPKRSALCLSGGGVRSDTFNLGLLQGLARHEMLGEFDYLSTVSGGGFIGGWLSAWIKRKGIRNVLDSLRCRPQSALKPDPEPVYELRTYSNYLSPKKGLADPDIWTLVAVYLRNLMLNWLVFIPGIMAALVVPRIWLEILLRGRIDGFQNVSIIIGFVGAAIALFYIARNLPSTVNRNDNPGRFVLWCLAPLVIAAMALVTYWAHVPANAAHGKGGFILFAELVPLPAWLYCVIVLLRRERKRSGSLPGLGRGLLLATLLLIIAQLIIGLATWKLAITLSGINLQSTGARLYATFSVPLLLGLLMIGGTLIAGLMSRFTDDSDQEWWARSGAYVIMVCVGWIIVSLLVFFGPSLIPDLGGKLYSLPVDFEWPKPKAIATGLVTVISGAISLLGGFSAKTPANEIERKKASASAIVIEKVTSIASIIFLASIFILLALLTNWMLYGFAYFTHWLVNPQSGVLVNVKGTVVAQWLCRISLPNFLADPNDHRTILYNSTAEFAVIAAAIIGVIGWVAGLCINTNRFSLHYYWRNRIIRAYLGASHEDPDPKFDRSPNLFTGFDPKDDMKMADLRPDERPDEVADKNLDEGKKPDSLILPGPMKARKLLHVINIALNLVGGDKLAWQDRKSESFTVSPLHSGSCWFGYRSSTEYADGISLGTAVAISGAAASPNMGYMMSSAVVRFIMTLFNVRLGFWLGNPGSAGDATGKLGRTFGLDSPRYSVGPIVAEALGRTSDKSPYVYLSDGGHFQKSALYEMVLRRCGFIVVSDASTDTKYSFDSLAMAIRQIRVDFGVPIEFERFYISRPSTEEDKGGAYCAIGRIKYSCADDIKDPEKDNGWLIYLKPSIIGGEPRDVLNYHSESEEFPQESIVDQFFSEAQFESYRALGSHIINRIFMKDKEINDHATFPTADGKGFDFKGFIENLRGHLAPIPLTDFEQKLLDHFNGVVGVVQDVRKIPAHLSGMADKLENSPDWLREFLHKLTPSDATVAGADPPNDNSRKTIKKSCAP